MTYFVQFPKRDEQHGTIRDIDGVRFFRASNATTRLGWRFVNHGNKQLNWVVEPDGGITPVVRVTTTTLDRVDALRMLRDIAAG